MARVRVWIEPSHVQLALAETADTPAARTQGLLGRDSLAPGHGLILEPCRLIHTWFMRFPIDVVFVDRHHRVTRVARDVRPFRFAWGGWSARMTLELPAGTVALMLAQAPVVRGTQLRVEPIGP
jgi:uncharacterized membrane protein (UPF0127 family)